jgi:hypothetical protein
MPGSNLPEVIPDADEDDKIDNMMEKDGEGEGGEEGTNIWSSGHSDFLSQVQMPEPGGTHFARVNRDEFGNFVDLLKRCTFENNYNLCDLIACSLQWTYYHIVCAVVIPLFLILHVLYVGLAHNGIPIVSILLAPVCIGWGLYPLTQYALLCVLDHSLYLPREVVHKHYRLLAVCSNVALLMLYIASFPIAAGVYHFGPTDIQDYYSGFSFGEFRRIFDLMDSAAQRDNNRDVVYFLLVIAAIIICYCYIWAVAMNVYIAIRIAVARGKMSFIVLKECVYYKGLNNGRTDINVSKFLEACSNAALEVAAAGPKTFSTSSTQTDDNIVVDDSHDLSGKDIAIASIPNSAKAEMPAMETQDKDKDKSAESSAELVEALMF